MNLLEDIDKDKQQYCVLEGTSWSRRWPPPPSSGLLLPPAPGLLRGLLLPGRGRPPPSRGLPPPSGRGPPSLPSPKTPSFLPAAALLPPSRPPPPPGPPLLPPSSSSFPASSLLPSSSLLLLPALASPPSPPPLLPPPSLRVMWRDERFKEAASMGDHQSNYECEDESGSDFLGNEVGFRERIGFTGGINDETGSI
ncbi:hypothetical protein LOK49_Contig180G00013 [Camellia lanceoleosa]|nr:hypothetical protein LOK49_Contig180G00013 [Camellia lanceoleosa]